MYHSSIETAAWQHVWRHGFAPQLDTACLMALARGLRTNDPALVRGYTTDPVPLSIADGFPLCGACAVTYALWKGMGLTTVAQAHDAFALACYDADQRLGEPAAVRWFLNAWDEGGVSNADLLAEVETELARRTAGAA